MSLKFYQKVLRRARQDPQFRAKAWLELWHIVKRKLPARLVTPRSQYVYCHIMMKPGKGRWLPPGSLRLRPAAYGIAFDEAGRVLLVGDPFWGFRWSAPGGELEPGETLVQALQREFIEETGLEIEVGSVVENIDEFAIMPTGEAIHGLLHFYLVRIVGGTLLPNGNGFDTGRAAYIDVATLMPAQIGGAGLPDVVSLARRLHQN